MPRPCKFRTIYEVPAVSVFKPRGLPLSVLESVSLGLDEFEAVRMADLEGLYQEEAAEKMGVSRQTFGNIVESARKKIADAIVNGKALVVEGGAVSVVEREFACSGCAHTWIVPFGTPRPERCPACGSAEVYRSNRTVPHPAGGFPPGACGKRGRRGRGRNRGGCDPFEPSGGKRGGPL